MTGIQKVCCLTQLTKREVAYKTYIEIVVTNNVNNNEN